MPIVVEDGTGLSNSNAYIGVSFVNNYLLGEPLTVWQGLTETEKETAIITACRYVDNVFNWMGQRKTLEQGLNWPRDNVEWQGFEISGIPKQLEQACAECVSLDITGAELYSTSNDKEVTSESVSGAVSVTYAKAESWEVVKATAFEVLNRLLSGLYIDTTASGSEKGSGVGSASILRV
jgi:hypothetical protein